jgi:hypothetical protein
MLRPTMTDDRRRMRDKLDNLAQRFSAGHLCWVAIMHTNRPDCRSMWKRVKIA